MFDKDGSGKVDIKELEEVMRDMGANVKAGDAERMIEDADDNEGGNGNGKIERKEFRMMMERKKKAAWEKNIKNENARIKSGRAKTPPRSGQRGGHWEKP